MIGARTNKRLVEYRNHVLTQNFVGSLRVFCSFLGLGVLFILALLSLESGTKAGLFAGGVLANLVRFGKFGFFVACLWGLFQAVVDYSENNAKECLRRKEMLAKLKGQ